MICSNGLSIQLVLGQLRVPSLAGSPIFRAEPGPTFPISCNRQQGHLNPFVSANRAKKCYGHLFWLPRWVYTLTGSDKPSSFKQVAWTGHAVIQLIDRELGYILRVSILGDNPAHAINWNIPKCTIQSPNLYKLLTLKQPNIVPLPTIHC